MLCIVRSQQTTAYVHRSIDFILMLLALNASMFSYVFALINIISALILGLSDSIQPAENLIGILSAATV